MEFKSVAGKSDMFNRREREASLVWEAGDQGDEEEEEEEEEEYEDESELIQM